MQNVLCEKCNKKKATVFYNENINGKVRSYNLCADCAKMMRDAGELEDFSSPFASFASPFSSVEDSFFNDFFSLPHHAGGSVLSAPKACPLCGATLADISATGKVGCATCYEVFHEVLEPTVQAAHGKTKHIGKVARGHRAKRERADRLAELRKQLKAAVETENFEEAVRLRDQIRTLEQQA